MVIPRSITWQCIGESESRLGEIVEDCLAGSGLLTGYRARVPYVDVKVWCKNSQWPQSWLDKLEAAIGKWVIARNLEDAVKDFLLHLNPQKQIQIIDVATAGNLTWRCQQLLAKEELAHLRPMISFVSMSVPMPNPLDAALDLAKSCPADIALVVAGIDPNGQWSLVLKNDSVFKTETHTCRIKGANVLERNQKMIAELAAFYALKLLKTIAK